MNPTKCLEDVPPDKVFRFSNGATSRNLYELLAQIKALNQGQFDEHSNSDKDDFIKWIEDVLVDNKLAMILKKAKSKADYESRIERRIAFLEKTAWLRCFRKSLLPKLTDAGDSRFLAFAMIFLLLVSLGLLISLSITQDKRISTMEGTILELKGNDLFLYSQLLQGFMQLQNSTAAPGMESPSPITKLYYGGNATAPSDLLTEDEISIYDNKIIITISNASLARFLNTGSMLPTLSETANSIEIGVDSPEEISVGDIIVYDSPEQDRPVIHRVVEIGEDELGWYAITKGDNNRLVDQYKVRFEDVKRMVVGVIY